MEGLGKRGESGGLGFTSSMSASCLGLSTVARAVLTICCTEEPSKKSLWISHSMLAASRAEAEPPSCQQEIGI